MQPRPQGAFPWLWGRGGPKAREKRPGDEVASFEKKTGSRGPFLENPDNFSGPESCFVFVVLAAKIKVKLLLRMIHNTKKLSVNEGKLTDLRARNSATIL